MQVLKVTLMAVIGLTLENDRRRGSRFRSSYRQFEHSHVSFIIFLQISFVYVIILKDGGLAC